MSVNYLTTANYRCVLSLLTLSLLLLFSLLQEMISESELDVLESKLRAGLHKLYNSRPMECYAAMDPRGTGSVSAAGIRYAA
jgi:hypothetical protein